MSCRAPQGHRRTLRNMEKYEYLGMLGEGSYGMVTKCRNKENGRIVAIKKFLEGDDDKFVKKIAMREIRLLKRLRHENLVSLLEVFKKKGRWFLVFEYMDRTLLDDLEQFPKGLDYSRVRSYLFQILRGLAFCHSHNIIHRDIKLENILVSERSVLKLCDFGFARTLAAPGEAHTEYVATRWYRAPELLVGDSTYGKSVDVWAVGCLVTEMLTGEPLFPGDSDIDQLYLIIRCLGNLTPRHQELFYKNPLFAGLRLPIITETKLLEERYPKIPLMVIDLVKVEDAEPKSRDGKPDSKALRIKASEAVCEKVATLERAQDAPSQNAGYCASPCIQNTKRFLSPGLGKEQTSNNYKKPSAVVIVPPISQGHPSTLQLAGSPWTGASGPPNLWSNLKMKRHKNLQGNLQQLPHTRPIDLLLNSQLQHKKANSYAQLERMGNSGRKQREAWRPEREGIHFPDLSSRCHVADPITREVKNDRSFPKYMVQGRSDPVQTTFLANNNPSANKVKDNTGDRTSVTGFF
ncbi:cyclin-dependent kinase-like 4 isoform X5 [Mobula birostris]|uniref:cyclin-dependent kinase-like 4 isoform X5 n=1 Tax=Mobula birostris TaxID=1983395 RepID=UPI003B2826C3